MVDHIRISKGGSESTFSAPGPIVLGRDASVADVVLDHPAVSRRHAQIVHDDGWVLTDLGSTNGTWIEGRKIDGRHRVSSAVAIHLGMQHDGADITVEPVGETVATAGGPPTEELDISFEPGLDSSDSHHDRQDETSLFDMGRDSYAGSVLRAKLGVTSATFPGVPGRKYTVGRDPGSDLTTDEEIVSRNHLELAWDGEMWTVTDVSARGTFTTGRDAKPTRLPKGIATPLAKSTTLHLGGAASGEPLTLDISDPILRRIRGKSGRS
jgi:pSer/pThr/pTyr-binding forkhead associated (FHA) protein